jgi:hypothetical protein
MAAKVLDLYIEQGATYEFDFVWADNVVSTDGTKTMVAKDITSCTARMQIRAGYCRPVILEATTENGRITLGGPTGAVAITLSATLTTYAPVYISTEGHERVHRRARYDLEVQWPDGRVDRVLQGKVVFSPNITRDPLPLTPTPVVVTP